MWRFHSCWHCHCHNLSDYILSLCTFSFVCSICCLHSVFVFCFLQNEINHRFTNVRRSKLVLTRCISYLTPCTDALSGPLGSLSFAKALYKVVLHLLSRCSNDFSHSQHRCTAQHGSRSSYITSCQLKAVLNFTSLTSCPAQTPPSLTSYLRAV